MDEEKLMIKESTYLKAKAIVEKYERAKEVERNKNKRILRDWMDDNNRGMSCRLFNILRPLIHGKRWPFEADEIFVEDIDKERFLKLHGAGIISWNEFVKERGF